MSSFKYPRMFDRDTKQCVTVKKISEQIFESLHLLIMSCYGELFGEPTYGASIVDVQFDKITYGVDEILRQKILKSIDAYIPSLDVSEDDILITQADDLNTIAIKITYKIKNTSYVNTYWEEITNGTDE